MSTLTVVVQVNGKVRSRLEVPATATDAEISHLALADPAIPEMAPGQAAQESCPGPAKLVNIVV